MVRSIVSPAHTDAHCTVLDVPLRKAGRAAPAGLRSARAARRRRRLFTRR